MPGRTSSRHVPAPGAGARAGPNRPADPGVARLQAQRTRREPDAAQQPCAEFTRYRSCGPTNGPAPRGCSCAISVFQTRRCASVSTSNSVRSRSASTVSGTSTAAPPGASAHFGARRAPPPERRLEAARRGRTPPGRSTPRSNSRCNRPRPSRKSNASQTWSATCPRLSTPCETAPFTTSRSRARAPQAAPDLILHLHAGYSSEVAS